MTKEQEINSKIIELTMHIREKYPALYDNLGEMKPVDSNSNTRIDLKELHEYYDSLKKMIKNHLQQHTVSDHRHAVKPINSDKFLFMQTLREHRKSVTGIIALYGCIAAVAFIAIFLISRALGFAQIVELRFLNYVALFFITGMAMRSFMDKAETQIKLGEGMIIGFFTSLVAFLIFSIFLAVFFLFMDKDLAENIMKVTPLSNYSLPLAAAIYVLFEGITFGMVISFILMQHYRSYSRPN
jgi:hypothetical protein